MNSFRLWYALHHPPRAHPLYRYVLTQPQHEPPRLTSLFFLWAFMCSSLSFCFVSIPVYQWIPVLLFVVLVIMLTLVALGWCVGISGVIVDEQAGKRYDLLAALPHGTPGASLAMTTGYLHRRASFRWIPRLMGMLCSVLLLTLMLAFLVTTTVLRDAAALTDPARFANGQVLDVTVVAAAGVLLLYLDYRYSLLTAVLIGMIAPVDLLNPAEAKIRALLAFMTIQAGLYAFISLLVLVWLPGLLALSGQTAPLPVVIIGLAVYLVLRESLVRWLWSRWMQALNSEYQELDTLLLHG